MQRQRRKLTVEDRVVIELRRKDGWGVRAIARELDRSPSVISAELGRDTDGFYAAGPAQAAATARRDRSGRRAKLAPDSPLFAEVAKLLRLQWSPEQIAGRRKRLEDGTEVSSGLRVSHEAIYQAIYAVPRGELRRELLACLRQGKPHRGRRSKDGDRRGRICDMTSIRERPAEVEGRLVPGHWEGDLIKGAGNRSSVGTLVERTSRKLVLIKLADAKAETARDGFAAGLLAVPAPLRLTLTYDQGRAHGPACLLCRPACPLAARVQREHQRPVTPVPAQGHRPIGVLAGRTRRDCRPAQQSAAQDARLRDPRRGVRRAGG
jgi:IS30 family transposase